jgi:hypothetical protein
MTIPLTSAELESIVTKAMLNVVNPWLTMEDMMERYHVKTTHTITAMERRGEESTTSRRIACLSSFH